MKATKKAGQVLKGEIILVKGLRWEVTNAYNINKSVIFFNLHYWESSDKVRRMGYARHKDRDIEWVNRK